ncbi:MAG TPA: outer membrane beta-barrel protein [Lysobacter sp.]|jgi:opacity protein-like surface antigen|nr:outer membrane beta-barrel protein [Lysobacter sp.]
MKKTLVLSCALALAALSNAALAADGAAGFVRAEIGNSDTEISVDGFSDSDSDTSVGFGGGYWFNANIGVEGHFAVLYNTELDDNTELDLVSLGVGVVGKKNFGANGTGFFIGGRAGIARMTAQVREDDFDVVDDESSIKPYYGVNVGYDFNENWGLSLNYDRRQGDFDGGVDVDVDTVSVGGEWRF